MSSLLAPAAAAELARHWEEYGKARLGAALDGSRPRVSAGATSTEQSRSGDSEPGRPRRRVRRGPASPPGLGEDEEVEFGEATERPMQS